MIVRELGSVCNVTTGQSAPQSEDAFSTTGIPFIRAGSLEPLIAGKAESSLELIDDLSAKKHKLKLFPKDTILFAKSGMSAKLARVYRIKSPCYVVSHLAAILPSENVDPGYLHRWFEANPPSNLIANDAYPSIKTSEISKVKIPLPPLPEQKRIAAILDKADNIRRKRQQAIQLADDFLRAVFLDMFGDPVTNPKGWEVRPLIELIDPDRPITYGILMPGEDIEGGVPYVRVVDMKDGVVLVHQVRRTTIEIAQQYKRSSLRAGDVLMSIRGHVGRLAVVPKELEGANITQDTARLATNSDCSSLYLYACLENRKMQQEMQRFVKGAAVKGINLGDVKQLRIPVPPIELQKRIERKIELMTTALTSLEQSSVCLLDGFNSLSQKAFSGRL